MVAQLLLARFLAPAAIDVVEAAAIRAGLGIGEGLIGEEEAKLAEPEEIHLPVSSTAISEIGWRSDNTITVTFHRGGTYTYDGDRALFEAFALSSSKGGFFNDHFQVDRPSGIPRAAQRPFRRSILAHTRQARR